MIRIVVFKDSNTGVYFMQFQESSNEDDGFELMDYVPESRIQPANILFKNKGRNRCDFGSSLQDLFYMESGKEILISCVDLSLIGTASSVAAYGFVLGITGLMTACGKQVTVKAGTEEWNRNLQKLPTDGICKYFGIPQYNTGY